MPIELPVREPCPFCRNLRGEVLSDEPRTKRLSYVDRDANVAAVVNPYQVSHGAVLVMPSRHAPTVLDLTEGEAESLARLIRRVAIAVHDALGPVGLNIYQNNGVASGQSMCPPLSRPCRASLPGGPSGAASGYERGSRIVR